MAAILYVEAKAAMAESNSDYANLNLATEEENAIYQEKLGELLDEFSDRFDENDFSPSNMPQVDIKVKGEYKNKIFYRPERRKSPKDQKILDENGRRLLNRGWAKLNPTSRQNINEVKVPRLDKDGIPVEGRDRVCLEQSWVNKIVDTFKHPIPYIQGILQVLADSKYFSDLHSSEAY